MKSNLAFVITLVWAVSASAITIDTVLVGDAGNLNDSSDGDSLTTGVQNFGAVGYAYRIGKYEVTVGQYTEFLNAVAKTDTYSLYDTHMASDMNVAGIARSGALGSYSYSVIGSPDHPVVYVSWGDSARFTNWLHNGQPTGPQNAGTTEDGAYTLNGAMSDAALNAVSRTASAKWFIPSENEWYKAAYYQPAAVGGDSDNYWNYPMRTNSEPYSDQPPGAAPDNTRVGNFDYFDRLAIGYNAGFAVSGANSYSNSQNYLTDVGAYTSSEGPYGTFDQGGNVQEWTESIRSGPYRAVRGGSWLVSLPALPASFRSYSNPSYYFTDYGFRVASIAAPEPSTIALVGVVLVAISLHRRKSVPHNRV